MKNEWVVELSKGNKKLTRYYPTADEASREAAERKRQGWTVDNLQEVVTFFQKDTDFFGYELWVTNDGRTWTTEAKFKRFDDAMFCMTERSRYDHREMQIHHVMRDKGVTM